MTAVVAARRVPLALAPLRGAILLLPDAAANSTRPPALCAVAEASRGRATLAAITGPHLQAMASDAATAVLFGTVPTFLPALLSALAPPGGKTF